MDFVRLPSTRRVVGERTLFWGVYLVSWVFCSNATRAWWLGGGVGAEMLSNRLLLLGAGGEVLATRMEMQVPRYGG